MKKIKLFYVSPLYQTSFRLLLFVLGITCSFNAMAQKGDRLQDLSYVVKTEHYVSIDDDINLKEVPDILLAEVTSSEITESYKKYLDSRNNPQTEITIVSSKDYFPKWQNKPKKYVLNQNGTAFEFNETKENFVFPLYDSELQDYNHEKKEISVKGFGENLKYNTLSPDDLKKAKSNGFTKSTSKNGDMVLNDGNIEIIINEKNSVVVKRSTDMDGNSRKEIFIYGIEFGSDKFLSEKIDLLAFSLGDQICATKVSHQYYSNYYSKLNNVRDENIESKAGKNVIEIFVPSEMRGKTVKVEIFNEKGELLREENITKSKLVLSQNGMISQEGSIKVRFTFDGKSKEKVFYLLK